MKPEEIKAIKDELNAVFTTIQRIDAPMTENNVVIMNACLGSIKFMKNLIEKGETENGNADAE